MIDPAVRALWRLTGGEVLADRASGTWAATTQDGASVIVKYFDDATYPDWRYPLRVAKALRGQGWPTPEPIEEPLVVKSGAWVMFRRLPGRPADNEDERRTRGRLLAEFHAAATATGIVEQRSGFRAPQDVVADPELGRLLRRYEAVHPEQGRVLLKCRDAAIEWFREHPDLDVPRSVVHGDFTPWNLLFDHGRLTGLLDFEATHYTFQVADFALSWRGYQDDVLRGYQEVRPLSELERELVRPAYRAWLFLGLTDVQDLTWQYVHARRVDGI